MNPTPLHKLTSQMPGKLSVNMTRAFLSFGGGVQTTALTAMACLGDAERPECAIFADTGWESADTYRYIDQFEKWLLAHDMKLIRVSAGNIEQDSLVGFPKIPLHTIKDGKRTILQRQCTRHYKVRPVYKKIRELMGLKRYQHARENVKLMLGISYDEVSRCRDASVKWIENTYPLVEMKLTRTNCLEYLKVHNIPIPPKSSCLGCPYRSDSFWLHQKEHNPKEFDRIVRFEKAIQVKKGSVFIHYGLKNLDQADFKQNQGDLFTNECEGFCGL